MSIETDDVDLERLVRDTVSELEPFRPSGVDLRCEIAGPLPTLETDPLKLKVIVKNLVRNAIKFTDAGAVDVSAYMTENGVEICVADTGIGIAPDSQETIFEAFQQLRGGQDGRGGVGLGLHIVRRLAEMLNGTARVESEVGRGSRFFLNLPVAANEGLELDEDERQAS